MSVITKELQLAVDHLVTWADREGMTLNANKTVAMIFSDEPPQQVKLKLKGSLVNQVTSHKQ